MVEIVLGNEMKKKNAQVPLSNSTVQRRMSNMATDIKDHVVQEIKFSAFGLFLIQLDESTNVASSSQLMVFARGNVTERVFELGDEIQLFFEVQGKTEFPVWLSDKEWIMRLTYLVDIFEQLNKLNLQMQGRNTNVIKFLDALKAFMSKLENWKRRVNAENVAMFEKLSSILDVCGEDKVLPQFAKRLNFAAFDRPGK
ncbi:zinc finger BED domain-containing protein 5-like [Palaemon carinicauda]|uniref:zinc finger BED domain-containing protein 5-like n=1 Tax=Palaemon carinicauda TaxID=392227 RepID=UPI0035B58A87